MDEKAWAIIKAILDRGNDAIIRKKESGFLIIEEKKKTVLSFLIGIVFMYVNHVLS